MTSQLGQLLLAIDTKLTTPPSEDDRGKHDSFIRDDGEEEEKTYSDK